MQNLEMETIVPVTSPVITSGRKRVPLCQADKAIGDV